VIGLYLFLATLVAITYLCLVIKIGFLVGDKTLHTGFNFGFYMITVVSLILLPICVAIGIFA
jgi:hypothetical protein